MSKRITITMDDKLFEFVREHARNSNTSMSKCISKAISKHMWSLAKVLLVNQDGKGQTGKQCFRTIIEAVEAAGNELTVIHVD